MTEENLSFRNDANWNMRDHNGEVFSLQSSHDSKRVVAGLSNGDINVHELATGYVLRRYTQAYGNIPATIIKMNPINDQTFLAGSADGAIKEWNFNQEDPVWSTYEDNNQIYALAIKPDGKKFASAGLDKIIRVYDYETQDEVQVLQRDLLLDSSKAGHSNRIFSIRYHKDRQYMLVSGGWDESVQIWDTRLEKCVQSVFGPNICGDSIDLYENMLLTGSWRTKDQLQIWDIRNGKCINTIEWGKGHPTLVYCCRFYHNGEYIIAGGSGGNNVKIFSVEKQKEIGDTIQCKASLYSLCLTPDERSVVCGTSHGDVSHYYLN